MPTTRGKLFNQSAIVAGSDILTAGDISSTYRSVWRLTVSLGGSTTISLKVTDDNNTSVTAKLNSGQALLEGTLYYFTFVIDPDYTYNFTLGGSVVVEYLLVEEVRGEVA